MTHRDPGDEGRTRSRRRPVAAPSDNLQADLLAPVDPRTAAEGKLLGEHRLEEFPPRDLGRFNCAGDYKLGAPAPEQPRQVSAGVQAKERALKNHESGHEDRLEYLRTKLRELYAQRLRDRQANGITPAYVTADDAAVLLEQAGNMGYLDDDEPRAWFGALFRSKGWRWVEPKLVPSLRDGNNGRLQRTWAWEPAP
jgi:hypothetical protein